MKKPKLPKTWYTNFLNKHLRRVEKCIKLGNDLLIGQELEIAVIESIKECMKRPRIGEFHARMLIETYFSKKYDKW